MKLYLMRHGQTEWNRIRKLQGRTDIPLNANGRYVAELTAKGLWDIPFDVAFVSPLARARETAEIILRDRHVPIIVDERIIEVDFGRYEGKSLNLDDENLQNFFVKPECYRPVEGTRLDCCLQGQLLCRLWLLLLQARVIYIFSLLYFR